MSVREFDGVDDRIVLDGLGVPILAGAFSIVAVIKPLAPLAAAPLLNLDFCAFEIGGGGKLQLITATEEGSASFAPWTEGVWQIGAVTRGASSGVVRLHVKPLGSGSWAHANSGGTIATRSQVPATTAIGSYSILAGVTWAHIRGKAFAVYDRELSDAQIEAIATTPGFQILGDLGAISLLPLNQASTATAVTDLIGSITETSKVGTAVITGDEPSGWSDAYTPATDYRLSGGTTNTLGGASLGGAKSSEPVPVTLLNDVNRDEAAAGLVDYRCIYVRNNSSSDALQLVWVTTEPGEHAVLGVGVPTEAAGVPVATIADRTTAPSGVTFGAPPRSPGGALSLGTIPAGSYRGLWIRRTVPAATPGLSDNGWTITVQSSLPLADVMTSFSGEFDIALPLGSPSAYVRTADGIAPSTIHMKYEGDLFPPLS
jgi:hypothetical protein